MKESLKLLLVAGVFMFIGGVSATHSRVIPDGTLHDWIFGGVDVDLNDPFIAAFGMRWNYNEENGPNAGSWTDEEVNAKVDKIYGYAMKEMEKICNMPKYLETQHGVCFRASGFGSGSFVICDGSNDERFSADQLGDSNEISFSIGEIAESGFMAYLIFEDCFKWVEKSNGSHLLIPSGVPSKRKIKELFMKFKNGEIPEDYREDLENQRKESKEFVAKNKEIGTGAMAAR